MRVFPFPAGRQKKDGERFAKCLRYHHILEICRLFIFVLCKKKYKSGLCLQQVENRLALNHSHKKRKDSLETRVVLLIFLLELEVSGVTVHSLYQNSKK